MEIDVGAVDETDRMMEENKVKFSYITNYITKHKNYINLLL
jgi:hypothetical protein